MFQLQPTLQNDLVKIFPLQSGDFELLYSIASDPLVWEQHPNKDRYQRPVFETFFKGAIESGGAFMVYDAKKGKPIGSSRYYGYDEHKKRITIGYTFIARSHWGKGYNRALKLLMLEHAFSAVDAVYFHIGAVNLRSQKAIEKLGAKKIGEQEMEYYGETSKLNYIYIIDREVWNDLKPSTPPL